MKRLLVPMLFAPGAAFAGLVIVSSTPATDQTKQAALAGKTVAELASLSARPATSSPVIKTVAAAVPEAAPAIVAAPAAPKFLIEKGQPIHQALESWAKSAGWTLIWYPNVSWKAISDVDMKDKKDVVAAVSDVITILRDEGKPVRLRVSDGNNVMEVLSTEVKND